MNIFCKLFKHKFEIIRTVWPFRQGWGVRCKRCKLVMDTGHSKQAAKNIVEWENDK